MKKQQVLVLHGGTQHETYEDYLKYLEDYPLEKILGKSGKRWKERLAERLGDDYDVISPSMPKSFTCRYTEWKLWIEKYFPILEDDIILIGHSLGSAFWMKYLNENTFPVRIKALYSVATVSESTKDEDLADFTYDQSVMNVAAQCRNVILYHSRDDVVVPFAQGEKMHAALPESRFVVFEDRGHFVSDDLPEIIDDIRTLE